MHIRTVGVDYIEHSTKRDENQLSVKIWDTAGQERFRTLTAQFYKQADGIIIAFDVTNYESFRNVRKWISDIHKQLGRGYPGEGSGTLDIPVILVGNKIDLRA